MKILLMLSLCSLFGVISTSAQQMTQRNLCFENDGLKEKQTVSLTFTGNRIEGTFESSDYDDANPLKTVEFTGTKNGNLLTIKFAGGKSPYELAPGTKRIVWTLGKTNLKIPTYGKNYDTGKYSTYAASYVKCEGET